MRDLRLSGGLLAGLALTWAGLASAQAPATTAPKTSTPAKTAAAKPPATSTRVKTEAAATSAARQPHKGEEQALKWFSMLDADGDGRVSRKEAEVGFRLRPSLENDFNAADLNRDGYLTQDEIRTVADRRRAERQARRAREQAAASRQAGGNSVK